MYCVGCDTEYKEGEDCICVSIKPKASGVVINPIWKTESVLEREVWNKAIEAAAVWLETANRNDTNDAEEIRKLKK